MRPIMTGAVLTALALGGSATAASAYYEQIASFDSPRHDVACRVLRDYAKNLNKVTCTAADDKGGATARWLELRTGSTRTRAYRSTGWFGKADATMKYGVTWYIVGGVPKLDGSSRSLRCTMRRSGVTCNNSAHGFRVAKGVRKTW